MSPLAIPFPDIAPEILAVEIGPVTLALRWYALAYIVGIVGGWRIAAALVKRPALWKDETPPMTPAELEGFVTWIILGIILGGRLGYVFFYQPAFYLENPALILAVWEGGMAFHGGLIGVVAATLIYTRKIGAPLLPVADFCAVATPLGIMLGRIANFINAELWGAPTLAPWGVIFPGARAQDCPPEMLLPSGLCARHPSQLYEAALEGLLLGLALLLVVHLRGWLKRPGAATGLFLLGYGLARYAVEFVREADAQFVTPENPAGHVVALGPLGMTMGQLLSVPLILLGAFLLARARARERQ